MGSLDLVPVFLGRRERMYCGAVKKDKEMEGAGPLTET